MLKSKKYPKWLFIVFPAISMLLGWGLRGYIGGGPFGAMIPGAMVALSMCLLLELPATATSIILVFGVFGIGLGGEMTYGQTLGFLRSPDTVWWGTAGTTLKGAMWGLLGGAVLSLGFVFNEIPKKRIIIALLLLIVGMFLGFKLINDPMVLYFSDPEKPRAESWAGLLFGAIFLIIYLKIKSPAAVFKIIFRFALFGMIGGALGFGLGGLWLYLGSQLPNVIFTSWWKAMEFSFGLFLGAFLGYAAWLSRKELVLQNLKEAQSLQIENYPLWKEFSVVLVTGLLVFWLIPYSMEWFAHTTIINNMPGGSVKEEIARMAVNYSVTGFIFVLVLMRFPRTAWQIGITLTFCHGVIDLIRDIYPETTTTRFALIFLMTAIVAFLTARFSRQENKIILLFLLLIWSTVLVAFLRLGLHPEIFNLSVLSVCEVLCGRFIVHIIFTAAAIFMTWILISKIRIVR